MYIICIWILLRCANGLNDQIYSINFTCMNMILLFSWLHLVSAVWNPKHNHDTCHAGSKKFPWLPLVGQYFLPANVPKLGSFKFQLVWYHFSQMNREACRQKNSDGENNTRNKKWPLLSNLRSSQLGSNWRSRSPSCWLGSNRSFPLKGQMK